MSITDDSTGLDLTWTEQPVVAFTAGTLSDIDELISELEAKIQRGTLSSTSTPTTTQAQRWLIRAKEEFMETHGYTFARRYAYATATSGSYRFALPPDFGGGAFHLRDTTYNSKYNFTNPATFDALYPDVSEFGSGRTRYCTIKDRELWVAPPADGGVFELEYTRTGDDNTATDISYIPEKFRWKLVDMAVVEAFEYLQEFDKAQYFQQKSAGRIALAKKSDGRKRWPSRALSMFEQ